VALATGEAVIVRLHHGEERHFAPERWAIERARRAGVPVPDVLLVEQAHDETGAPLSVCVERKLPGRHLGSVARAFGREHPRCVRLLRQAGALLARIHAVEVEGFGPLDEQGRGSAATWDGWLLDGLAAEVAQALLPSEAAALCQAALDALEQHRALLRCQPARLLHWDYEPSHIFVSEDAEHISGIIDWEGCKGGDPVYDLVQWHLIHDAYAAVWPFMEGYAGGAPLPDDFHLQLGLYRLAFRLDELTWDADPERSREAIRRLETEVASFERGRGSRPA
jgi:aminoglycoside phosphotransferase (APT) family kinase protein